MKQLTRSEFNKQGTTYKSVTSPESDAEVTQITDIVENNGNFSYSTDGSNFKTITSEIQKIADVTDIYPSPNALPVLGAEDDGVIYGTLNNGVLPLDLYKYSAATSSWQYVDTAKEGALYIDSATGLIYQFSQNSPYFYVTSYTKISQLANDVDFLTATEISAQISDAVSEEATARQNADTTLQNNINNAVSTAETAVQELHTAIQNEASARQTADATLQSNIDAKQDTLTAGTNITIENNVISATVPQITVDSALSTTSENPVQNKIVTGAINGKMDSTNPTGTGSLSVSRRSGSTIGANSVAMGYEPTASGFASFATGSYTSARAEASFAEGENTIASGLASHAGGNGTTANHKAQQVFGEYNIADASSATANNRGNYVEIVGNGTASVPSNARTLDWSGNEVLAGTSQATGFKTPSGTSSEFLKADGSIDSTTYATSSELTTGLSNKQDALTTTQLDAVNSGINDTFVAQISTNQTDIANEITARQNADATLQNSINAKYTKPSAGIPATDLASAVQTSLGKADTALQSISSSDVTTALGFTPYNATNPNGYTKVEASNTNGNIKINGSETNVYTLPSDIATDSDVSAVQSNLNAEITAREGADTTLQNNINIINGKIPAQASTTNQLADKDFVNSSINAFAAYYITKNAAGDPFATKAELTGTSTFYSGGAVRVPTTNDYCIVLADESKQSETGVDPTTRYSYQGNQWEYQYTVNDTPLTAAQLAALNSGATSTNIAQISTNASNITLLQSGKQDTLTFDDAPTANSNNPVKSKGILSALVGKADRDWVSDNYALKSNLSTVATTGDYDDLINKPVIPTAAIVDTVMSTTSTNPVQNKVISEALSDRLQLSKLPSTAPTPVLKNRLEIESSDGSIKFTNAGSSSTSITQTTESDARNGVDGLLITTSTTYTTNGQQDYILNPDKFAPFYQDNTTDLGNTAGRWRNLYLGGSLTDGTNSISVANIVAKQNALNTAQLNAVNSGVTSTTVSQVATNTSNISSLQTNKQDKLTAGANITISNNVISASGGTSTTVKVDDVSVTSNYEANIVTKSGDYNSTSNRLLTENNVKEYTAAEIEAMFN